MAGVAVAGVPSSAAPRGPTNLLCRVAKNAARPCGLLGRSPFAPCGARRVRKPCALPGPSLPCLGPNQPGRPPACLAAGHLPHQQRGAALLGVDRRLHPGLPGHLPADVDVQGGVQGVRGGADPQKGAVRGGPARRAASRAGPRLRSRPAALKQPGLRPRHAPAAVICHAKRYALYRRTPQPGPDAPVGWLGSVGAERQARRCTAQRWQSAASKAQDHVQCGLQPSAAACACAIGLAPVSSAAHPAVLNITKAFVAARGMARLFCLLVWVSSLSDPAGGRHAAAGSPGVQDNLQRVWLTGFQCACCSHLPHVDAKCGWSSSTAGTA